MEEIRLTSSYVNYPVIYRVSYLSGGFLAGFLQQYDIPKTMLNKQQNGGL